MPLKGGLKVQTVSSQSLSLCLCSASLQQGSPEIQARVFTFVYVRGEASDKDLPGVALHPLSILTASGRVQARGQGGVAMAIIKKTILEGKKTGAAW